MSPIPIPSPAQSGPVLRLSFPDRSGAADQDEEWFVVDVEGERRRLRLHDYAALYETPGLYESLVYEALECRSPERVVRALEQLVADAEGCSLEALRVLDLGAGNGIVGDLLRERGCSHLLGVDILPEAADAAERDRPGTYDDYLVADLAEDDAGVQARLRRFAPDTLVTVAALGFGDIPPRAFRRAFDVLPEGGWVALCIKDRFLEEEDDSGFGRLLRGLVAQGALRVEHRERYVHRRSVAGQALHYVALIGRKREGSPVGRATGSGPNSGPA